jgi:large subunit ribosomal protein L29
VISLEAKDLRELNDIELAEKEKELSQELFNLRFRNASGQLENTAGINKVKKDLARAKTVIRERQSSDKDPDK